MINPSDFDVPHSVFELFNLIQEETWDMLGDVTIPLYTSTLFDSILTFFFVFFIAKWVFDILVSLGKGGMR